MNTKRDISMNEDRRLEKQLGKAFGFVAAIVQVIYWVRAVEVSHHASIVDGESEPYWNSGGPGSFFPWPKPDIAVYLLLL